MKIKYLFGRNALPYENAMKMTLKEKNLPPRKIISGKTLCREVISCNLYGAEYYPKNKFYFYVTQLCTLCI
jgi:hypothetical protein